MKLKLLKLSLLFVASISLSASNNNLFVLDDKKSEKVETDSLIAIDNPSMAIKQTASTLLDADGNAIDTSLVKLPNTYAWLVDARYGDRILVPMDTVRENFHRSALVEGRALAPSYLSNLGGPMQPKEFFARKASSQFPFMDAYEMWRRSPEKHLFLNTKIPYSNVHYQTGGGKEVAENHFKAELSSNFGKRLNVGFNFDYIYARGYYRSQFNKQTSYDFNASYIGDRYKLHLFAGNNNLQLSDNGGIRDDRYITHPESEDLKSMRGRSLDIPVVFEYGLKNKLRGRHVFITNSYDIGRDKELVQKDDTTQVWKRKENYVAPASIILTSHYADQRRLLTSSFDNKEDFARLDSVFVPNIRNEAGLLIGTVDRNGKFKPSPVYDDDGLNDYMSHYTFTNTLAFRMNEGFKEWTKFSLTAFVEHEMRRFLLPGKQQYTVDKTSDDVFFFGGKLSKNQGKYFRFDINAIKGINSNDLEVEGNILTSFSLGGRDVSVSANTYFKNMVPDFFQENFRTRNWMYENSFNDTKRFYVGGKIDFPKSSLSETSISGGYENITDHIYIGEEPIAEAGIDFVTNIDTYRRTPMQSSKSVNVLALKLNQKLKTGIFHFDLTALLQKSSDNDVIPLPLWTVYANVYLQSKVSKVLTFQLGVDAYMHEEYAAPGYDPLFGQFYVQRKEGAVKLGNFPHANVYLNLHLKYTRFFLMMYNVAETMGNKKSFTTPHHPINPMMFRWGLSWKFNN